MRFGASTTRPACRAGFSEYTSFQHSDHDEDESLLDGSTLPRVLEQEERSWREAAMSLFKVGRCGLQQRGRAWWSHAAV